MPLSKPLRGPHGGLQLVIRQQQLGPTKHRLAGKDLADFIELDLTTARVMVYLFKLKA